MVRFATIPAAQSGWMTKESGTWTVTDEGLGALDRYTNPEDLFAKAETSSKESPLESPNSVDEKEEEDLESEVEAATSLEGDQDNARSEILEFLGKMPPFDFQAVCAKLVSALGHEVVWISPPGPDGGLDFVAYADPIGASGRRIKGQAKRQQSKQDVNDVGAFTSKLKGDDVGVFIALGGFTKNALADSFSNEQRLILLDGADLINLWIENYGQLDEEARDLLALKPVWRLVRDLD